VSIEHPQAQHYAETPCKGKEVRRKDGTLLHYDPSRGGQLTGPKYTQKYYNTSLCVQLLIDEHEQEHLADKGLQAACDGLMKASAAVKAKATKETREASAAAKREYDTARKKGECAAYTADAECIKKLRECCVRAGEKKTKKRGLSIYCCDCKDVEAAAVQVEAGIANNCPPEEK
jgi:hypothetical protein